MSVEIGEIGVLTGPENLALLERYIDHSPDRVALALGNAPLASWIKNLQKARKKLPSYYAARCLITSQAYQQSSSESTARAKAFGELVPGRALAVDLTCGLGVDSLALSEVFEKVISVEVDEFKAAVARYNFEKLGVHNVEVVCCGAEDFVIPPDTDFIYVDPSREDASGRRVYSLQQSSPDITQLMPRLMQGAHGVMVKLSPMYDIEEAFAVFDHVAVEVVSLDGECKEVLVLHNVLDCNTIQCTVIRGAKIERITFARDQIGARSVSFDALQMEDLLRGQKYLHLPDVAFYKSRTVEAYAHSLMGVSVIGGYLFSVEKVDIIGQSYLIDRVEKYSPKHLKKLLKSMSVKRANLHLRDFPHSAQQVSTALGVGLGGEQELFFTKCAGQLTVFFVSLPTQQTLNKEK